MPRLAGTEAQLVNLIFNSLHAMTTSGGYFKTIILDIDVFENYLYVYQNFGRFMHVFLSVVLCPELLELVDVNVQYGSRKVLIQEDEADKPERRKTFESPNSSYVFDMYHGITSVTLQRRT